MTLLLAAGAVILFVRRGPSRRKLVDDLAAREKAQGENGWWWLSFVDPDRPDGERFLGVAIVEGYGVGSASRRAHELQINPGGEVHAEPLTGDAIPPAEYRNRLLSKSDLEEADLIDEQAASPTDSTGLKELNSALTSVLPELDFEMPPLDDEAMVFTCKRVWNDGEPIRYVSHDNDGAFQFLCGGNEHTGVEEVVYLHARHVLEKAPEQLCDLRYLRKGCFAERVADDKWNLGNLTPEHT